MNSARNSKKILEALVLIVVFGCCSVNAATRYVPSQYSTIQAAIDAAQDAGGGTVLFPEGTYYVASTLSIANTNSNIRLEGVGANKSGEQ